MGYVALGVGVACVAIRLAVREADPQRLSLDGRSKLLFGALALTIVVDLVAILVDIQEIRLLSRVADGAPVSDSELDRNDAYGNLPALGARDLRFGHGWSMGSWFVPVLNLWRPKQNADDIWRASNPDAPADQGREWRIAGVPALFHVWWAFWIIGGVLGQLLLRSAFAGDSGASLRSQDWVDIASLVVDTVGAVGADRDRREDDRPAGATQRAAACDAVHGDLAGRLTLRDADSPEPPSAGAAHACDACETIARDPERKETGWRATE